MVQLDLLDTTISSSSSSTTDRSTEVTDLYTLLNNVNGTLSTIIDDSSDGADSVAAGSTRVYIPVTQATRQANKVQRKRGSSGTVVGSESKVRVRTVFLYFTPNLVLYSQIIFNRKQ